MQDAGAILAVRGFALVVKDLLEGRVRIGAPSQRTASHGHRVVEVLPLKLNDGDVGDRA
jgi:hypothetical protein